MGAMRRSEPHPDRFYGTFGAPGVRAPPAGNGVVCGVPEYTVEFAGAEAISP